jgi:MFS transporter, SP family, general alpha glucoside:H+ symporter
MTTETKDTPYVGEANVIGDIDRDVLNQQAEQAERADHEETIMSAVGVHGKAVFWAFVVSMCVIMEGYDTSLLGNFYAFPAFAKKFGMFDPPSGTYQLSAPWQAGLGNSSGVGAFFGL